MILSIKIVRIFRPAIFCGLYLLSTGLTNISNAESFSCPLGSDPACLDYGAVVCKSMAKCVSDDAVCFESFQCGYQGFVCKSKLDDAIEEYENIYRQAKFLEKENATFRNELINIESEFTNARDESDKLKREFSELSLCVESAATLHDTKSCF